MEVRSFLERLKSRKFLVAIATILLIILNEMVGLDIPSESYWAIILPGIAYILGEAYTDGKNK
jgi:uncharacterized membrane protein